MKSIVFIKQKHLKYGEYFAIHYPEQDCKIFKTETNMKKTDRSQSYNHFHNILRPFDILPNFPFTLSEKKRDY